MTDTALIVLGMLAEQPRHPYDVEEQIRDRNIRDWATIGFSTIYYVLASLEKKRLVTSKRMESPDGPERHVYSITKRGRETLETEALARLQERIPSPESFYAGVSQIPNLDLGLVRDALERHMRDVQQRLDALQGQENSAAPLVVRAMLALSRDLAEAEEAWIEGLLGEQELGIE